mmetsp:Transcript_9100/g.22429  ORF Transcript_9100/g.22429 Transcript_9100/m.22429 type:complete len:259 (-) Transcript_9100:17-793(-)
MLLEHHFQRLLLLPHGGEGGGGPGAVAEGCVCLLDLHLSPKYLSPLLAGLHELLDGRRVPNGTLGRRGCEERRALDRFELRRGVPHSEGAGDEGDGALEGRVRRAPRREPVLEPRDLRRADEDEEFLGLREAPGPTQERRPDLRGPRARLDQLRQHRLLERGREPQHDPQRCMRIPHLERQIQHLLLPLVGPARREGLPSPRVRGWGSRSPTTQDQMKSNCKSQFPGFQGEYTPKVDRKSLRGTLLEPLLFTIAPRKI